MPVCDATETPRKVGGVDMSRLWNLNAMLFDRAEDFIHSIVLVSCLLDVSPGCDWKTCKYHCELGQFLSTWRNLEVWIPRVPRISRSPTIGASI
jgi:hypothetical protein